MLYEIQGTYGSFNTPCSVFVYTDNRGMSWYCVKGNLNINATWEELSNGIDIELLYDQDRITASEPINSLEELEIIVDL